MLVVNFLTDGKNNSVILCSKLEKIGDSKTTEASGKKKDGRADGRTQFQI